MKTAIKNKTPHELVLFLGPHPQPLSKGEGSDGLKHIRKWYKNNSVVFSALFLSIFISTTTNCFAQDTLLNRGGGDRQSLQLSAPVNPAFDANHIRSQQNNLKAATGQYDNKFLDRNSKGPASSILYDNRNYNLNSKTGNYEYNTSGLNTTGLFILPPLTQWGLERTMTPAIR